MKNFMLGAGTVFWLGTIPFSPSYGEHGDTKHPTSQPTHTQSPSHTQHTQHKHSPPPSTRPITSTQHQSSHGGHHPPIDCPLRKQGIHAHKLRPFVDIQKYIQMLEKPDRVLWQKPDAVVRALGLKGHEIIADVGAGSGYFTFRFAKQLPKGNVFAIDIEPDMLKYIHHKAMLANITNIRVILSKPDDPKVPASAQIVFICDVLHHVEKPIPWLQTLFRSVASGTKVVLLEFKAGKLPQGPPESLKIPKPRLLQWFHLAGFTKVSEQPHLLPYQEFLVFQKP